jgi:hypothetical protein
LGQFVKDSRQETVIQTVEYSLANRAARVSKRICESQTVRVQNGPKAFKYPLADARGSVGSGFIMRAQPTA